ncbi:GNAT family N-acetyltransferase [Nocardiopsis potens]|uniref:GNAT family N-acetyltransferase n=1 Tax=Nocardiopsis potens TaxID=1246458 RepID=UPI000347904F|nr:GNAT family N-acetyltransferase [Nocardiopsis potens]
MTVPRTAPGGAAPHRAGIELLRLDRPGPRVERARARVGGLRPAPGQRRFVDPVAATLPKADATAGQVPFAVLCGGEAVGFGVLDASVPSGTGVVPGSAITDAPERAVLLRSFLIALERQGQGIGRAACARIDPLAREVAPAAREVLLTVNAANPAAHRAYLAGGFADTGRLYLGGDAGPQHVLAKPLPPG